MAENRFDYLRNSQRLTQAEKDANEFKWYKDQCNLLDSHSFSENNFIGYGGVSEYKRKKVNYDLFNNIINLADFEYVCRPYGAEAGELPANMTNRDIVSGKIKVLLGMEMDMPFSWKVTAVNEEATTRKEQEEFGRIREYVVSEIMKPIRLAAEKKAQQQAKGRELTPDEEDKIQQQIEEEVAAQTPDEVRRYMSREHQDPAEALCSQLLEYTINKEKVQFKFNKGWKHMLLTGEEIYYVGVLGGMPHMRVVNPLFFDYDKSPDVDEIENGEWGVAEYRLTPTEIVKYFGSKLKDWEIDKIYKYNTSHSNLYDADFTFSTHKRHEPYTIRVLHTQWKSLRKIGFLTYKDPETGAELMDVVGDTYKLNPKRGDIKITWEWIPETHECWKILNDIFVYPQAVPGQHTDINDLYSSKLSYFGAALDSLNSPVTSPMDRAKAYQYYYDIIFYRIELLMASDKGKILAANINAVPKSSGIDIAKFTYFMEANKIAWLNPQEEGNKNAGEVTNMVKEIDMSLATQINNYIQLAEYIERKCGDAIGVTKQMEGAIGAREAVSNTQQSLVQSSYVVRPYFDLHNMVKQNVLTALLEATKVAYSGNNAKKLTYVLDDLSQRVLEVDQGLLATSTLGLFITNSAKAYEAKKTVEQLAQAAIQNQQASLLDIVKIVRSESVQEAEELLMAAKSREEDNSRRMEEAKLKQQAEIEAKQDKRTRDQWAHDERMIVVKEEERRKTEVQKQTIFSVGFDTNKDQDKDGTPDVLEVARFGVDADIQRREIALKERDQIHKEKTEVEKLKIEKMKASQTKKSQ